MSEQQKASNDNIDDSSRSNLSIMAAAAEHISASSPGGPEEHNHSPNSTSASPTRRAKLVLPKLTPAMQQDLALTKSSSAKALKPLSFGSRPEFSDYALQGIVTPHPNDVLCGRGGGSNNHPGNESFRELVNEVKFPYVNCPKREKPLIARRIVEAVRNQTPPGRFLSKDSKTGLWNDIGDGKAREKTSQALREGAPIIREHMTGKPSSPTNVAAVLKEAKKAERAEKEYGVKLPKKSPVKNEDHHLFSANAQGAYNAITQASPAHPKNEPTLIKRGTSMGHNSPLNLGMNNSAVPIPPLKKFRSFPGEQEASGPQPPTAWPPMQHQPPGRNFNMIPYGHHHSHMMGGYAPPPPPRGPHMDYSNAGGDYSSGGMPRYPGNDSVPVETVRRLLLGQLDPVQLALQILSPEEASMVARRHAGAPPHHPGGAMRGYGAPPLPLPPGPSPTMAAAPAPTHPLKLNPVVSDGSSSASSVGDSTQPQQQVSPMRRIITSHSDQSNGGAIPDKSGDDGSSVDSAKRSDNSERALPKKKRKYVEDPVASV
eukprot:CAMPEP_0172539210 /NCGR_PEP_ID=MMETSP1067-20121228/10463_1 /TAXON_ID=265564 ORGANISM="Thalassiosira punctigera, Strain Tpunct2005C2" /NCGR_SAMPLE_ID=MMETSP1067 /ASSEMBLY_ACC=CAM_ASM_000444 /LENGTH=541 /DNA_ID=CAMNT_0013324859 /DNA_START=103 /DNA_END=1728 /DNA_ORIENTATION=+